MIGEYDATTGAPINPALITGLDFAADFAISGTNLFFTFPVLDHVGRVAEYTTSGNTVNPSLIVINGPHAILVVPEPSVLLLLAAFVCPLLGRRRRTWGFE